MAGEEQSSEHHVPIWGIFLLFIGAVFLLQTTNVLPWALWGTLWRFWPVLIIIIGLGILLRHYNVWLVSLLILVLLFTSLGIAIWQFEPSLPTEQTTKSYSEPLDSLERAQIEIDFAAGSLTISSLPPASLNFVEVGTDVRNGDTGIRVDFHRQDSEGKLQLIREQVNGPSWGEGENRWQVRFNRNIPLVVDAKSAASNIDLDLSELKISELRLDLDVGSYTMKMPSSVGTVNAYIKADLSNVEVIIPDAVAARLKADVDLSILEVDESRFTKKGDYYISQDFDSAKNRIELELDCDLSRVLVK